MKGRRRRIIIVNDEFEGKLQIFYPGISLRIRRWDDIKKMATCAKISLSVISTLTCTRRFYNSGRMYIILIQNSWRKVTTALLWLKLRISGWYIHVRVWWTARLARLQSLELIKLQFSLILLTHNSLISGDLPIIFFLKGFLIIIVMMRA